MLENSSKVLSWFVIIEIIIAKQVMKEREVLKVPKACFLSETSMHNII